MGSPNATQKEVDDGRIVILIGLILQLASLFLFIFVLLWFVVNVHPSERLIMTYYLYSLYIGITLVIIRNIYRVAEFAEGSMTSGALNEREYYVLLADACTMWLSCFFFAIWSMESLPARQKYDTLPVSSAPSTQKAPQEVVVTSKNKEIDLELVSATKIVSEV